MSSCGHLHRSISVCLAPNSTLLVLILFHRCIRHGTPSFPRNRVSADVRHLQVVSAIYAFFLAMVLYPDVQAKAQAEVDSVVGSERFPSFNDRDSLPYVNALCKEVLRWHTVGPLGTVLLCCDILDSADLALKKRRRMLPRKTFIMTGTSSRKERT